MVFRLFFFIQYVRVMGRPDEPLVTYLEFLEQSTSHSALLYADDEMKSKNDEMELIFST